MDMMPLKKRLYLYSINFNFESHICGSFNIFLFDFNARELKIIRDSRGTRSLFYVNNENEFIFFRPEHPNQKNKNLT